MLSKVSFPPSSSEALGDFAEKNPVTTQKLVNALMKSLKWLETAKPEDVADLVPPEDVAEVERQFAGLLILGINLDQARVLARLNNVQITQVAKFAAGEVYEFIRPVQKMQNFQSSSRQQFAVALLAA